MDLAEARKISPDERRNAILDIAHEAFMRDGYAGASMSRIAAQLGGSKTTLYNYFASKKELFVAVTERESARLFEQLFAGTEVPAGDFKTAILELARRFLTVLQDDHIVAAHRLIVAESGRFPEVGQTTNEMALERGIAHLTAYFKAAMDGGVLRKADPRVAAEQFVDLTSGHLHKLRLWNVIADVEPERIAREAARIANTFLAAFGNDELSRAARDAR